MSAPLIMFLAFSAQVQVRPYLCPAEHEGVLAHNATQALRMPKSVYARLQARLATVASMQRKEARPSALPRRQGRRGRHYDFAQWFPKIGRAHV